MNANEVIANRALEILGSVRGDYDRLHPLDHVNLSQSTNDVYPTAIKLALQVHIATLHATLLDVVAAFGRKAEEFKSVLKMGRTQLQDAVPMTLGQEFGTYAIMVAEDAERLLEAAQLVSEINLGGTAIGSGLAALRQYIFQVVDQLRNITGRLKSRWFPRRRKILGPAENFGARSCDRTFIAVQDATPSTSSES